MDSDVKLILDGTMATASSSVIGTIVDYLPVAGAIVVTIAVMYFGIKVFFAMAHFSMFR